MPSIKLLIVEDDATSQLMLKGMLKEHTLMIVDSGEVGIEAAQEAPDLIILDINLPGIDGYETCRQLRKIEQTRATPIIFLSSYTALEDRLKAYGAGGNDYINKPFDATELHTKIKLYSAQQQASQELANSHDMLIGLQTSAAKIQSISRFIQATLFCHDIDMLFQHFFRTAREIEVGCVLQIHAADMIDTRSSDGTISTLEREILELSSGMQRIHAFGQDRAIFRWNHATLLTRKVGDMIDTIALFMDALEAGIKSVESESKLLKRVATLEAQNTLVRDRVSDTFKVMQISLKDAILSLGIASVLDINDEDRLNDLIDGFSIQIDAELQTLVDNNNIMKALITELRTPPPELQALMNSASNKGDGIELF